MAEMSTRFTKTLNRRLMLTLVPKINNKRLCGGVGVPRVGGLCLPTPTVLLYHALLTIASK